MPEAAAPATRPRLLLVVGMHRSGTSLLSHLLWRCGAHLGGPLDQDPLPSNETGHWEHREVVAIQERLLADLGRIWHRFGDLPLPAGWLSWPEARRARDRLLAIARAQLAGQDHWLLKDPRSTPLLPLWQEIAAALDADLRLVLALREPGAVVASLAQRNGMPAALAEGIWRETHRALLAAAPAPLHVVCYDALLADPLALLPPLLRFCGLPAADLPAAAAAVVTARRHHRAGETAVTPGLRHLHGALLRAGLERPAPPAPLVPLAAGEVLIVMRTAWREQLLPRALRSVLAQSYPHWHLHVVNDGGPAAALEQALEPYRAALDGRLDVSHLLPARGMEAASNLAIASGRGAFIAIHDDDDTWLPRFLERSVAFLAAASAPAVIVRAELVRERMGAAGMTELGQEDFGPWEPCIERSQLEVENRFPPIALLCRRGAVEQIGPYRAEMPVLGDWEFNLRLAGLGPIPVLAETLARWHRRPVGDALPNSDDSEHRRYRQALWRHLADGCPARPILPMGELVQMPLDRDLAWLASDPRRVALRIEPARAVAAEGEAWVATDRDPQLLLAVAAPLPAGLYLLHFRLSATPGGGPPQLFHRAEGAFTESESLRLEPTAGGRYTLLLNLRRPHAALRLDPMDEAGRVELGEPLLLRLGAALEGLRRHSVTARLPDFICIGAQRAGTTWLHEALSARGDVWLPPVKELHYFDDAQDPARWQRFRAEAALSQLLEGVDAARAAWLVDFALGGPPNDGWYSRMFDAAPAGVPAGEITPAYATLDEAGVERLLRRLPGVRVLILLRDPVLRSLSGAAHELRASGRPVTAATLAAELEEPRNRRRSDYRATIERWSRHLPPERLGLFFHDDLLADPQGTLNRIAGFLGLPPGGAVPRGRINGTPGLEALDLTALKSRLAADSLPDLRWLAQHLGGMAADWLRTAETRLAVDARLAQAAQARFHDTRTANLMQWDRLYAWPQGGDEWQGQARAEGHGYAAWKASVVEHLIGAWIAPGSRILEIGPGHGRWTESLATRAGSLVLVDVSPNCLDLCRDRFTGVVPLRCHLGRGDELPADLGGELDAIWSFDCLVHVAPADLRRYLGEIARVLRPGGVALLHHANRRHGTLWLAWLRRLGPWPRRLYRYLSMGLAESQDGWRSAVSARLVRRWAERAGLEVVDQLDRWGPGGKYGLPRHRDRLTILRRASGAGPRAP